MKTTKDQLKPMITLFKAHQQFSKYIKEDISHTGLDLNEFSVLEIIYHYKNISVNEIHEKTLVAASSLSYILDKLEKKDLVKRNKSKVDRRSFVISLTEEGIKYSLSIFPPHYDRLIKMFEILNEDEKEQLTILLKKIGLHVKEKNNA